MLFLKTTWEKQNIKLKKKKNFFKTKNVCPIKTKYKGEYFVWKKYLRKYFSFSLYLWLGKYFSKGFTEKSWWKMCYCFLLLVNLLKYILWSLRKYIFEKKKKKKIQPNKKKTPTDRRINVRLYQSVLIIRISPWLIPATITRLIFWSV